MADVRHIGNTYGLYVSTGATEPASPATTANYDQLGLETGHDINLTAEQIDAVDKDSGAFATSFAGLQSYTLNFSGNLSQEGNTAQDALETAALATTQADKTVYWLSTPLGASNIQRRGSGRILSFTVVENVNEVATFTGSIAGIGAYTRENAST